MAQGARGASFEVAGLSENELARAEGLDRPGLAAVFQVFVASKLTDPPPILGSTSLEGKTLRFTPRFGLEPGLRYRAVLHRGQLSGAPQTAGGDLGADFEIPKPPAQSPTMVTHIYPTSDRLPENQLKFYLHFSAPMGRGEAYRHLHLLDADGKAVDGAFLELGEELWDRQLQRFTLLFDPGRVKRGLKPREDLGSALQEGQSYTLVVDRDWPDANGVPLEREARKSFQVLPRDEEPIDPTTWSLVPPPSASDPLVVRFLEPLDHALLERMLWITDAAGETVAGSIDLSDGETCWRFHPRRPWRAGNYHLLADSALEDLAGNSIGPAFDVDVLAPIQQHIQTETVSIPFTVGAEKQ